MNSWEYSEILVNIKKKSLSIPFLFDKNIIRIFIMSIKPVILTEIRGLSLSGSDREMGPI